MPEKSIKNPDPESQAFLSVMGELERVRANRVPAVRTALVVLSSAAMVYDVESLRQKISLAYPEAAVFFITTQGKSIGPSAPDRVDLLIDFTGPGQRQGLLFAKKLRRLARIVVGRNAGFFRKRIYDRVFDERAADAKLPVDILQREREVQKQVLSLAGVALVQSGDTPPDRGKSIALELPPLART